MIWNKSDIKPDTNHSIIFLTENNKFCTLSEGNKNLTTDWKWLVEKYAIKIWGYQQDLINDINFQIRNYKSSAYEKFEDLEFTHNEQDNIDALDD